MVAKLGQLHSTRPSATPAATTPPSRRAPTLRHRLLVFAFAAALPLLLLASGAVWRQNRAERLRAEEVLVARAHAVTLLLDREFAVAEQILRSRPPPFAIAE
ncbi:hypothetical protein [Muricoccus aerilatus]|uniref:hypothetical protein n=1 Tax=Muricoccus aerilatus TaxID=452982 RepID=UPI0005C1D633|nr:hypothetical protein [Roseomonas aerilata]